jgi:adenylosuccinate synthase
LHPDEGIKEDFQAVYENGEVAIGWPAGAVRIFDGIAREHTVAIIGGALGDEGKGRIVDNKIESLLKIDGVKAVSVIRFGGGGNAGHSVEQGGLKLALHRVPSGILYPEAVGLMDTGIAIHPGNLKEEVEYIEEKIGSIKGRLILSENAILTTNLEQGEEVLNRTLKGRAKGGTGRGISPSYARHYDRLGLKVKELMDEDWREKLAGHYERYDKLLTAFGLNIREVEVPDLQETKKTGKAAVRKIGTKEDFLKRLEDTRRWLKSRDMVKNTFTIHRKTMKDMSQGILFEGAQAVGLHPWLGTRPDVTSSDTTVAGISTGTQVYRPMDIADRLGVIKLTYTSSVGARQMPTEVRLPKDITRLKNPSREEGWAAWVREEADEYGTTTRRPRDILHLDLAMIGYNCQMAGIEVLAGTHLDIARDGETIEVCTHYTNSEGKHITYQPGLEYQEGVVPHYVQLPGWNGKDAANATSMSELPENALKYLAFIQRRLGFPIVAATTGPSRENMIEFAGYEME